MTRKGIPEFEVVPDYFARGLVKPRRAAVDWRPVIEALVEGKVLFLTDEHLPEGSLKYLRLALSTRQAAKGQPRQRLHSQRELREAGPGRLVWVEPMESPAEVPVELAG